MTAANTSGSVALSGIRVLDLTRLLPGPYATQMLGGYGADVLKVEDTGLGDYARDVHPLPASGFGAAFTAANAGKRSLSVDLKHARGRQLFLRLVRGADVLVESFRPGTMDRLGLGWGVVNEINPRLIYCSLTGYGQATAQASLAGHDLNYQGYAGLLPRDRQTGKATLPATLMADVAGGSYSCVIALMAALLERNATGRGRRIDLSITHSAMMFAPLEAAAALQGEAAPAPGRGRHNGGHPCYALYDTADDRQITFAALEYKFWRRFCEQAGCEHLLESGDLADPACATRIRIELQAVFARRTQREWLAAGAQWDVCIGPVWTSKDAIEEARRSALPVLQRFAAPLSGAPGAVETLIGRPADLAAAPGATMAGPPTLGQHTREVLLDAGLSAGEIDSLLRAGVVRTASRPAIS